ncbi:hypothetical protein [Levilactobacillus acidifarinae]|uniref:Glycosyltransferase RgtA/B/C/D-like domain-containing protein n=1 Tax=Levilactobacillus acidifarinae DSM 19394 = JCM 15949 TaxID=1423715 RepID=A0A0R1LJR4_9LACO|nr:hypothetical protein [Levilactobacillus acidifarinae]KRK96187.1 hypothetical protein FD25_GL002653 [Levilactobacillus acidifarinae DSM 19394]GEO69548.1 membrane protein [Levilactobacillus acidifarinae]
MELRQHLTTSLGRLITLGLAIVWGLAILAPVGYRADQNWWPPLLLVLTSLVALGIAGWFWRRWTKRSTRWQTVLLWGLLIGLQVIVALNWVATPHADLYFVHQQALDLLHHDTTWNAYFQTYPNNVSLTLLLAGLLRLGRWVGIDSGVWLNLIQFAWLDCGLAVMAHHLRKTRPGAANTFLGLALTCVPFYAYGLNTYSDILVLPAGLFTVVLMDRLRHATSPQRWWGTGVLLGLPLTLAYLFKANFIVLVIAVILILWLLPVARSHAGWAKLGLTALLGLCLIGGSAGSHVAQRAAGYTSDPQKALPAVSWIAMGANPAFHGDYNRYDAEPVIQAPTAQAKKRLATAHLKSYLHQLGPLGILNHLGKKARLFLATGTFDAFQVNSSFTRMPTWYRQHRATAEWLLANWAQLSYCALLLVNLLWGLQQWRRKTFHPGFLLGGLFALGLTAFHVLFWETEERYALPLLPLLLAGTAVGLRVPDRLPVARPTVVQRRLTGGLVLLLVAALGTGGWSLTRPLDKTVQVVSQNEGRYYQDSRRTLHPGQHLTQSFTAPVAFNRLLIDPNGTRIGQATLRQHGRTVWQSTPLTDLKRVTLPQQPAGTYQLTVTNRYAHHVLHLVVAPANFPLIAQPLTGESDHYLRFIVTRSVTAPGLSWPQFGLFAGGLTLLTLGVGTVYRRLWWP